jgi:hypothetical protein
MAAMQCFRNIITGMRILLSAVKQGLMVLLCMSNRAKCKGQAVHCLRYISDYPWGGRTMQSLPPLLAVFMLQFLIFCFPFTDTVILVLNILFPFC